MRKRRDRSHKKRRWTQAFKLAAVCRLTEGARIASLAAELGVGERLLYDWSQRYRLGGAAALRPMGRPLSGGGTLEPPSVSPPAGCERRRLVELERKIGEQQVERLRRADNLLCLRKPAFRPATTDSRHRFTIYPNLAAKVVPTSVNQLWVADITYVRLAEQFVYLAVVLDAFSRKVIGWALEDHLRAELALDALGMALGGREVQHGGLIHHSDRGTQYACGDYIDRLGKAGIVPSMSRAGCPWDNAMAESFMATLKREEVDGRAYRDLADARSQIGRFLEQVYNRERLHSALGYRPPDAFEAELPQPRLRSLPHAAMTADEVVADGVCA